MQHLEVSGAVRHIYIYVCVIRRLKVKELLQHQQMHSHNVIDICRTGNHLERIQL